MAETSTFTQRLDQVGLSSAPTPTSQTQAQGLGATPQQTAMTGTQAQKQATISSRIEDSTQSQQQDLQRAQRLGTQREPTVQEHMDQERQEQLARLGNLGLSIQNTINQNLEAAAQAQQGQRKVEGGLLAQTLGLQGAQVDLAKADPNSHYNKVNTALNTFLTSGDPNDLEAAMATIDNLKQFGLSSADAKRLVGLTQETMAKQTGQSIASNVMDRVSIKDINLQELGFEQGSEELASLLDIDVAELGDMDINEFADMIEDKRKAEFSRIDNLKAELAAAPLGSVQREALLQQLRDMGQVGVTGVEAEVAETAEDIDLAGMVKIGDETVKVEDFLADENISQLVSDWINETDPAKKDQIIPEGQFPELTAWIRSNELALAELSETADDTLEQYETANDSYQNLGKFNDINASVNDDVLKSFIPGWDKGQKITSSQMKDVQAQFNASSLGQITLDSGMEPMDKRELLNKFNNLSPEVLDQVKGMSTADIKIASGTADELQDNPDLAKFLGVEASQGFVLDDAAQDKIAAYAPVMETISRKQPHWLRSTPQVTDSLRSLSPESLQTMTENPDRFDHLVEYSNRKQELENATDVESKLKFITGEDINIQELRDLEQDMHKWAWAGDPEAQRRLNEFKQMFEIPGHGRLSEVDINRLVDKMSVDYSISPEQIASGQYNPAITKEKFNAFRNRDKTTGPSGKHKVYENYIRGNTVRLEDIQNLPRHQQAEIAKWAESQPGMKMNVGDFNNYDEYIRDYDTGAFESKSTEILGRQGFKSMGDFTNWIDRVEAPGGWLDKDDMRKLSGLSASLETMANTAPSDHQRELYTDMIEDVRGLMSREQEFLDRKAEKERVEEEARQEALRLESEDKERQEAERLRSIQERLTPKSGARYGRGGQPVNQAARDAEQAQRDLVSTITNKYRETPRYGRDGQPVNQAAKEIERIRQSSVRGRIDRFAGGRGR